MQQETAETIALTAVRYLMEDEDLRERFFALSGVAPDTLRQGLGDPAILEAILGFFADYEPDLMRLSAAIDTPPETVIKAWMRLGGTADDVPLS